MGHRSDSVTVRLPGPQPTSATRRGTLGTDPREQVVEGPAAVVSEGEVGVWIPHIPILPPAPDTCLTF